MVDISWYMEHGGCNLRKHGTCLKETVLNHAAQFATVLASKLNVTLTMYLLLLQIRWHVMIVHIDWFTGLGLASPVVSNLGPFPFTPFKVVYLQPKIIGIFWAG